MSTPKGFLRRLPLSLKMVALTVLFGGMVSMTTDWYVGQVVDNMFKAFLEDDLQRRSQEDRLRFDHYMKGFHQVVRIATSQKKFSDYLDEAQWFVGNTDPLLTHSTHPAWFLSPSVLRILAVPRFTILLDSNLKARELFHNGKQLPLKDLLEPPSILLEKSYDQTHISVIEGIPYMMTAEAVQGDAGRMAVLLLASPIDDELLSAVQGDFTEHLMGLVSEDGKTLLAGNDAELLPAGSSLQELDKQYVITGREYHDYGAAEMVVHVSSFMPREKVEAMAAVFVASERKERMVTALAYIFSFTLVMLWVTRRIQMLTLRVEEFSRKALGGGKQTVSSGDRLHILEERFEQLTDEVIESHQIIKKETEERIERQHKIDEQDKQLTLLESVSVALGVGVMLGEGDELRPVNDVMKAWTAEIGDLEKFAIASGKAEKRTLTDGKGEERIFRLSSSEILADENVVLVHEITKEMHSEQEREKLQKELVQAQRMESIGRLAGGVAHDFNNILTAINGYAELTLMKMDKDNPLRENLKIIFESGERASDLVSQLLAFSRRQIIRPEVVNLNRVVASILKMLSRLIGEDVKIVVKNGEALWNILADQTQVEQVILNLAVNARDAMPAGGQLLIETENVRVEKNAIVRHQEIEPGEYVRLMISDTGTGIQSSILEHIFEPFFTTKEMGKGTGLGLATVYGIVKQNKGFIYVYSEMGGGTTFKIYLPRIDREEHDDRYVLQYHQMACGDETIMLVEDEQEVRNLVVSVLSELGYTVLEASDGVEASDLFRKYHGRIDLLLTDVIMPRKGGTELAAEIVRDFPQVKVLYMTGYTEDTVVKQGILKEGIHLIQKPLTPGLLASSVRKVLDVKKV